MNYKNCTTHCNDKKIVVHENKSRFEVTNEDQYTAKKIQVDGCLIGEDQEKCDWIICSDDPKKIAFFIELKGSNIDKAISQLASTLRLTKAKFDQHKKQCFAVTTRIPKQNTTVRRKCIDFFKEHGVHLNVKNLNNSVKLE